MISKIEKWVIGMEMKQLTKAEVLQYFPERKAETHKGDYGKILLLCGSVGYTGAPALAAMGALRIGAGLVYLGVPESIYGIEAIKLLEPIIMPLPDEDGMLSTAAIPKLSLLIDGMDAILVGPGLGRSDHVEQVVRWILENYSGPVVLDADGINVMQTHKDVLRGRTSPTILTPHEGEFCRFGGSLEAGRTNGAVTLANETGSIVVLKGHKTVITDGQSCYINTTGNPGMAVGGSGDVLAGMILGLLGQGLDPMVAAAAGVWLHGAAGDICAEELGQYSMLPSDIVNVLPRLLNNGGMI